MRDDFQRAGVYHFLVVSGLHVGFWILFIHCLLAPFPWHPRTKVFFYLPAVVVYAWLCNFSAPVVRASLMAVFCYLGILSKRPVIPWHGLLAAGLFFLLLNPLSLFEPGWQLTFGITLGLVVAYPAVTGLFPRVPPRAAKIIFPPLVAQVSALPLVAFHFGYLPLLALATNMLLLPLAAAMVVITFFSLGSGALGFPAAAVNQMVTGLLYRSVQVIGRLPYASVDVPAGNRWYLYLGFLPLVFLLFFVRWKRYNLNHDAVISNGSFHKKGSGMIKETIARIRKTEEEARRLIARAEEEAAEIIAAAGKREAEFRKEAGAEARAELKDLVSRWEKKSRAARARLKKKTEAECVKIEEFFSGRREEAIQKALEHLLEEVA